MFDVLRFPRAARRDVSSQRSALGYIVDAPFGAELHDDSTGAAFCDDPSLGSGLGYDVVAKFGASSEMDFELNYSLEGRRIVGCLAKCLFGFLRCKKNCFDVR